MMQGQTLDFGQTPSQTVGPYFAYGLTARQYGYDGGQPFDPVLALPEARGERIRVEGRVFDGDGKTISDALVEISQPDGDGRYARSEAEVRASGFRGFGRCGTGTDDGHRWHFLTVKPGVDADGGAPHINLVVTMRGLLVHTFGRIYFDDEAAANAADAVLQSVPAGRRQTLIARRTERGGEVVYQFDIHMQGPAETVFFDL